MKSLKTNKLIAKMTLPVPDFDKFPSKYHNGGNLARPDKKFRGFYFSLNANKGMISEDFIKEIDPTQKV
jgi:hypothetical protein